MYVSDIENVVNCLTKEGCIKPGLRDAAIRVLMKQYGLTLMNTPDPAQPPPLGSEVAVLRHCSYCNQEQPEDHECSVSQGGSL